jgi:hypothetical protein
MWPFAMHVFDQAEYEPAAVAAGVFAVHAAPQFFIVSA